jgi:hypothetical protein
MKHLNTVASIILLVVTNAALQAKPYVTAEAGGSWTLKTDIEANPTFWDQSNEGYKDTLKSAPFFGLGIGINCRSWLAAQATYTRRGIFKYRKCQTSSNSNTPDFLATKLRRFDLDNASYMFDFFLNRAGDCMKWNWEFCNGHSIAPYAGAGIGFSINTVSNFDSVLTQSTITFNGYTNNRVASIMTPRSLTTFSWQVRAGFDYYTCDCFVAGLSYRFFDGGKIRSKDFIIDTNPNVLIINDLATSEGGGIQDYPVLVPAWRGKLRAHELVVSFGIMF